MCRQKLLQGLPERIEGDHVQCEICLMNKMYNLPFEDNRRRAKDILEIVHTDVNGPLNPTSIAGERYFVSFIDDFSRIAKVYCIKNKSEVFECFEAYMNLVENMTGKRIKELRCDNGREYINKDFYRLAKNKGIYINACPPYTHELNGVAERFNRTVMDRARCLISEANVDKKYWPIFVETAVYIGNRLLTNTIIKRTPYEIFTGRKPDVSKMRIIGSKVFVRIPEAKRTSKLNPKAVKGILVGYTDTGYKILVDNKMTETRHVIFIDENARLIEFNENGSEDEDDELFEDAIDDSGDIQQEAREVIEYGRPQRTKKMPEKYKDFVVYVNTCDANIPENYEEAINNSESGKWKKAMQSEINSLERNGTWELVDEPIDKNIIEVKWIYTIKSSGIYKARVVARGFQQMFEENEEIYSPVARMTTLKVLLSTACVRGWYIEQMDVETAFLNGNIKSEVYIYPPDGYDVEPSKVCLLKKALYGLRESPRDWYDCINSFFCSINLKRSAYDYCLYTGSVDNTKVYIILYVDDLLITGENKKSINKVKQMLSDRFRMKDLGCVKQYLGIDIDYNREEKKMILSQEHYIVSLAEKYNIKDSKGFSTPMEINLKLEPAEKINDRLKYRNLIGALLYVANGTRPDVAYSVNYMSRFQKSHDDTHYKYALRILKYLYHTRKLKMNYGTVYNEILNAYVDADWAADIQDRKSTSGIVISVFGNVVMWRSQKQKIVSRASTHAEYYALADCVEEVLPIKGVLGDLDVDIKDGINIYEDNTGAIGLAKNGKFSKNSKHIDISYHFVNDYEKKGLINVQKISTDDQVADMLTKALGRVKFQKFRELLGVRDDKGVLD